MTKPRIMQQSNVACFTVEEVLASLPDIPEGYAFRRFLYDHVLPRTEFKFAPVWRLFNFETGWREVDEDIYLSIVVVVNHTDYFFLLAHGSRLSPTELMLEDG